MIRLSRLSDYGVVLMSHMASAPGDVLNAHDVAAMTGLPLPTVSKLLSVLARERLLVAHRGAKGGYTLAREPDRISVADIVSAVDGPISLTQCLERGPGVCHVELLCLSRRGWRAINDAVRRAFEEVSLADIVAPMPAFEPIPGAGDYSAPRRARVGGSSLGTKFA